MIAQKISLNNDKTLSIQWDDGHNEIVSLTHLRDECPCAECKGETILLRTYKPEPKPDLPGKYELKNAQVVGNYGLQLFWGDGHSTGIYTWKNLRDLCECEECVKSIMNSDEEQNEQS